MSEVRIAAEPRTEFGKGPSRRIRRANKVPAVLYGHGEQPRHFSLPGHELMLALKHDANALLTLQTEDGDQLALPKVIVRDPIKGYLEHVDLVAVRRGEKVTVDVPVIVSGEAQGDVIVDLQSTSVSVEADATAIPESIEVDVSALQVGTPITAGDLVLPAGTTLVADADLLVVQVTAAPTAEQVDAELAEAEAELGAGQAGAAAIEAEQAEAAGETPAEDDSVEGTGDAGRETEGAQAGPADS